MIFPFRWLYALEVIGGFSAQTYLYRIFKLKEGCAPTH